MYLTPGNACVVFPSIGCRTVRGDINRVGSIQRDGACGLDLILAGGLTSPSATLLGKQKPRPNWFYLEISSSALVTEGGAHPFSVRLMYRSI